MDPQCLISMNMVYLFFSLQSFFYDSQININDIDVNVKNLIHEVPNQPTNQKEVVIAHIQIDDHIALVTKNFIEFCCPFFGDLAGSLKAANLHFESGYFDIDTPTRKKITPSKPCERKPSYIDCLLTFQLLLFLLVNLVSKINFVIGSFGKTLNSILLLILFVFGLFIIHINMPLNIFISLKQSPMSIYLNMNPMK